MKPTIKPPRTAEQRAEEDAIRRQHGAHPIRQRPAGTLNQRSFAAIFQLVVRFKAVRESQGLTLAVVAAGMGLDAPALSRLETGKMLNPSLSAAHRSCNSARYSSCASPPNTAQLIATLLSAGTLHGRRRRLP